MTNKAPRRKQRGINCAPQSAGSQLAFAPRGGELNPQRFNGRRPNKRSHPDLSIPTKIHNKQGVSCFYKNDRLISVGLQKLRLWHKNDTSHFCQRAHCRMRRHIFTELSPIAGDLAALYVETAERSSFEQVTLPCKSLFLR